MNQPALPENFIRRMEKLLKEELSAYLDTFQTPSVKSFHINTFSADKESLSAYLQSEDAAKTLGTLKKLPFGEGWLYTAEHIGQHPLHHAGILYSQDPAAMLPALLMQKKKGIRILDLCAAPGGKTSQLAMAAAALGGFVLANEPHPARCRILLQNMERMGYRNVTITRMEPEELQSYYAESFDLVVVDAPCSGEGMFRKYPESITEWSEENIHNCSERQRRILDCAVTMLRSGGQLIYSTCTYAPEENEEQLRYLQEKHGLQGIPFPAGIASVVRMVSDFAGRCYPHTGPGEGQFLASLKKPGETVSEEALPVKIKSNAPRKNALLGACLEALSPSMTLDANKLLLRDNGIFLAPEAAPTLLPAKGVVSAGIPLGSMEENGKRFLPAHRLFSSYPELFSLRINLSPEDPRLYAYLRGEELDASLWDHLPSKTKAYGVITCLGAGVGGFRLAGGRLKNLYPKGLRNHL